MIVMMSTTKTLAARDYQKRFWMLAARQLPHHTLLIVSTKLRAQPITRLLRKAPRAISGKPELKTYPSQDVDTYLASVERTKLWHGTGRFQHHGDRVVDVLQAILKNGSLNPASDVYALLVGGDQMVSISTTPYRVIARSYADTHGKGEAEPHRFGSSLWWAAYCYSVFYGELFTRYGVKTLRNWSKWDKASADQTGERQWGKKVHTQAISVWDVFGSGSDIAENYPIVFGVMRYGVAVKLPNPMARVEIRLTEQIELADISHIEVPEARVNEVVSRMAEYGYDIPVFPIELGEFVSSTQSVGELLGIVRERA